MGSPTRRHRELHRPSGGALCPGPAGATESLLDLGAWDDLVAANPVLTTLTADVEALLVRAGDERHDAYVVPIDRCYELVGHMRRHDVRRMDQRLGNIERGTQAVAVVNLEAADAERD